MAKQLNTKQDKSGKMALTAKSLRFMIAGLAVLAAGFLLLSGGGS